VADGRQCFEIFVGEEFLERPRLHHRAGQVVRAARLALLDDGNRNFAELLEQLLVFSEELQETVGRSQTSRPTTDNGDADFDELVLASLGGCDELGLRVDRRRELCRSVSVVGGGHGLVLSPSWP
jgi:hypothetical protein